MSCNEPIKYMFLRDFQQIANKAFPNGYSIVETDNLPKRYDCLFEFDTLEKKGLIAELPILDCYTLKQNVVYHRAAKIPEYFYDEDFAKKYSVETKTQPSIPRKVESYMIPYLSFEFGDDDYHQHVKLIAAPKGQLWKLLHWANHQNNKTLNKPILDEKIYKATVSSILRFLKHRKKLKKMNVIANKGILIHGEPGNGKTLITSYIKNIAENMGLTVGIMTEKKLLENRFYGDIVILDDFNFDSLCNRGPVADILLSKMDGPSKEGGRVYIITTNEVTQTEKLLPPLLRPGRIDSIVHLKRPTKELRKRYVDTWSVKLTDEQINEIINKTSNFSFAQLNHIQTELSMMEIEGISLDIDLAFKNASLKLGDDIKPSAQERTGMGFFASIKNDNGEFEDLGDE